MRRSAVLLVCGLLLSRCACEDDPLENAAGSCVLDHSGGFCRDGRCSLIVEPFALEEPTVIELAEVAAIAPAREIALGETLCHLGPETLGFSVPARLGIDVPEAQIPPPFSALDREAFILEPGRYAIAPDASKEAAVVSLRVSGPIDAGVTLVPQRPIAAEEVGKERYPIDDPASFFRNVSREPILAAFFDGQRLYASSGGRVMIWRDGVPRDPSRPPDVVLGRPDLLSGPVSASASSIEGVVTGIWSDGRRLAVVAGHRVLIWNRVPESSFAPADLVLGQDSFDANVANGGGDPGASTLSGPDDVTSDGTRLLVADTGNHRVLAWNGFPVLNHQPADLVIGQPSFEENTIRGGAITMFQPRAVYLDAQRTLVGTGIACACVHGLDGFPAANNPEADFTVGIELGGSRVGPNAFLRVSGLSRFGMDGLATRESIVHRANVWRNFPQSADRAPDFTLGKPDAVLGGGPLFGADGSAIVSSAPQAGIYADAKWLLIPDGTRLSIWRELPRASYAPADLVIGQPGFTIAEDGTDFRGISSRTLAHPAHLTRAGDRLIVADRSNNRVLIYDAADTSSAAVVLGQRTMTQFSPNADWHSPSAATLNGPIAVATDGVRLAVADSGNHRVLIWDRIPQLDGTPADRVIGQQAPIAIAPNGGADDADGDGDFDASASSLFRPSGVMFAGDALVVSDTFNHRVLIWDPLPERDGGPATAVLGQPDFTSNQPNRGSGWMRPVADGLALPAGLALDPSGRLWVADRENNRAVRFSPPWSEASTVDLVLGQPSATAHEAPSFLDVRSSNGAFQLNDEQLLVSASTLRRPTSIAVHGDQVVVADSGNHRLTAYPLEGAPAASWVIGQPSPDRRVENSGGLGSSSLAEPWGVTSDGTRLWVADTHNHRILGFDGPSGTRPSTVASALLGQIDFTGNGENGSAEALGFVDGPGGLSFDGRTLWVADRLHHRVLGFVSGQVRRVLGQITPGRARVNAGAGPGRASAASFHEPSDVFSDGQRLVVADRNNHRVLIWNRIPERDATPADVVLGQPDANGTGANSGRGVLSPDSRSMLGPEGVYVSGERLYVADTGNNRVLIFEPIPTTSGAAASRVLCQADFTSNLGNRGGFAPSAEGCNAPADVLVIGEELYIADALNHRVLIHPGRATGTPAVRVLGQQDFTSRSPLAGGRPTADRMNEPSALAHDGKNLFVADRGNHRVLVYEGLPDRNGQAADRVLGQVAFDVAVVAPTYGGLRAPVGLAAIPLGFHRTKLFVSDAGNDRVLAFDLIPRAPAD